MVKAKRSPLRICLNIDNDPRWHAGTLYIHNLIRGINALPAQERQEVHLSVAAIEADLENLNGLGTIDAKWKKNLLYLLHHKAIKFSGKFLPLPFLNFRRLDFIYPTNLTSNKILIWGGWIPDFQHIHLPYLFTEEEIAYRNQRNGHIANSAGVVILSSENARQDFISLYPHREKHTAVLQFVSHQDPSVYKSSPEDVRKEYQLPEHFWIVCNQVWKHKDHGTLVEAMSQLKAEGITPTVVWTGATEDYRNPGYFQGLQDKIAAAGLTDQIRILGFISREHQVQLIRASSGIIQPSLFEGWSTVVEDGKALGKPMVVSDLDVHREQDPPGSFFFKRRDAADLADKMKLLLAYPKGFQPEAEKAALRHNEERQLAFGRNFVRIVKETLQKLRS